MRKLFFALVLSIGLLAGCERARPQRQQARELETVDIEARSDSGLMTEHDQRARMQTETLAGVLPSDFPSDLPVLRPSSIVDFGEPTSASRFVTVDTSVPLGQARSSLDGQLRRAGWRLDSTAGSTWSCSKDGRKVRIVFEDLRSGTRIRYEY